MGAAFDGRFSYQQRIGRRLLLDRRPGAAEQRTSQEEGDTRDVPEFPRHISHPTEAFMEVADEAILPCHLFFGGDLCDS
jgi:hypothetical protein